jgi:hypothetical protein
VLSIFLINLRQRALLAENLKKIEIILPINICWRDSKMMDEIRVGWILSDRRTTIDDG